MSFSATVNLGTVGVAITSVKLYGCTGTSGGNCTGCTALTGYENVSVSTFPLLVSGIPTGVRYIQAEALGACSADSVKQCISISGIPGPTATPAPTMTPTPTGTSAPGATPNPTNTQTPTPTPTGTSAPSATMTPTPTGTLGGGACYSYQYGPAMAGCTIYWKNCAGVQQSTFVAAGQYYSIDCAQSGTLSGCGPFTQGVSCDPVPTNTMTPTPSSTPNFYGIRVNLQGASGTNGNLTIYQSSDNITFESALTLTSTDNEYKTSTFNGTPGYYYYMIISKTSGTTTDLNLYTQVNPSDFNPGGISGAWCQQSANTLQSDTFQLPNPMQSYSEIIFFGGLGQGCL